MSTIVISAGRNIGKLPMSNGQWNGMREQLSDALRAVDAEVFTRDAIGNGEWLDGLGRTISEESVTYVASIDDNKLPDAYNAITYFKKSDTAKQFFDIVRNVFENWDDYKATLKCNPQELATTDWAYSIACHIMGIENTMLPTFTEMSMVHMKQYINGTATENWTDTFVYECLPDQIRVQTVPQLYPFHYHVKNFCDKIVESIK